MNEVYVLKYGDIIVLKKPLEADPDDTWDDDRVVNINGTYYWPKGTKFVVKTDVEMTEQGVHKTRWIPLALENDDYFGDWKVNLGEYFKSVESPSEKRIIYGLPE